MVKIAMDISASKTFEPLRVKRGDTQSRFFVLQLWDKSEAYTPPEGAVYSIRFENKLHAGWYDTITLADGSTRSAVTVSGNELTCEIAEAATWGNGKLCVMIETDTGYQLALWDLDIISDFVPGEGSGETQSYYNRHIESLLEGIALYNIASVDGTTLVLQVRAAAEGSDST